MAAYKHKTGFLLGTKYGFPEGSMGKESTCNPGGRGDVGSIPGWDRHPEGENGNPFQYSCLKNPMDRGIRSVAKRWTQMSTAQRVRRDLVTKATVGKEKMATHSSILA